jgi:ribosomal protein L37AE/L43A
MTKYICSACGATRYHRELTAFIECIDCAGLAYREGLRNTVPGMLNEINRTTIRNTSPRCPGYGRYFAAFGE